MGETTEFCPNCGHKVSSSDVFCTNCGADLNKFRIDSKPKTPVEKVASKPTDAKTEKATVKNDASKNDNSKDNIAKKEAIKPDVTKTDEPKSEKPVAQKPEPKPTSSKTATTNNLAQKPQNKSSRHIMPIIILVAVIVVAYFGGSWYFGKNRQSQKLAEDITSGMTTKMASAAVDESGNNLTAGELKPLVDLYNRDSTSAKDVSNAIEFPQGYNNFKLIQTGKYFGLYPKYKVQISKQYIEIDTNVTNPIFEVDGQKVAAINDGDEYKLDKKLPGVYQVSVESGTSQKAKSVLIPASGRANQYTIDIAQKAKKQATTSSDDSTSGSGSDSDLYANAVKHATSHHSDSDDNDSDDSDSSDDTDLIGTWSNDTSSVTFNNDGTYSLDDKNGTYKVDSQSGDQVTITYSEDGNGGSGWTASYTVKDGELELNSNHMTWDKE